MHSVSAWTRRLSLAALFVATLLGACKKNAEPLPELGSVGDFSLVNERSEPITAQSLRGKVWIAAFFFTRCPTICPRITRRLRALQVAAHGTAQPPLLVSFSVDPDNDTPPLLLEYAKHYDADLRTWSFLTGDLEVVKRTVVDGFKLALDGKA